MADEVKKVELQWQVNYKQLTEAEKAQQRYITSLKKMNQMHGVIVRSSQQMDQAMQRQVQATGLLGEGIYQTNQLIAQQTEALKMQTLAVVGVHRAIEDNTTAHSNNVRAVRSGTQAQQQQSKTVSDNTKAWIGNIKTLALYTVGAASMFRIVMKIRREMAEMQETIFKNTEEYKRLTEAKLQLKAAFMAFLGTEEAWKNYFDRMAQFLEWWSDALNRARATTLATAQVINEVLDGLAEGVSKFFTEGWQRLISGDFGPGSPIFQLRDLTEEMPSLYDIAATYLDEYNEEIAKGENAQSRYADALHKAEDEQEGLTDAQRRYQQLLEQLVRAEENRIRSIIDLYSDYERKLEDIVEATNRALADLALSGARQRADIELAYQRKLEDIERQQQENRARNEERYRLQLLRIEMRYRERLIRIQEDFDDAMYDAIAKRDATAALMAIRRKEREEGRATRERNDAIALATAQYNMQIAEQQRSLERMREDARIARQRALEDLAIDLERERQDIQTNHDREMEDLEIFLERRRHDIEQDYEWQVARAQAHYTQDEQMYAAHLQNRLTELQNYYRQVAALYNTYAGMLASPLGAPTGGLTSTTGLIPGFAEGGIAVFDRPTRIDVAERGPEIVIAQPVSAPSGVSISGSIQHQISGSIAAAMEGFEGRMGMIITEQVIRTMGDILQ